MANIPIEVNTGETKTITFHTAGTFNTDDIVFSISSAGDDANTTMSGIAYCETTGSTAAKTATMPGFELATGQRIFLQTKNKNTATSNVTLSVNGTEAKPIKIGTSDVTSSNLTAGWWVANYDGTNWVLTSIKLTDSNTDTKVKQGVSTTNEYRKILLGYNSSTETGDETTDATNVAYVAVDVEVQPSSGTILANRFVKNGGTESQFLKANGSVDDNTYSVSTHNHDDSYSPLNHVHAFSDLSSTPTTISGYGITDAKIDGNDVVLGSNTLTVLTPTSSLDATKLTGAVPTSSYIDTDYVFVCSTAASTAAKTATSKTTYELVAKRYYYVYISNSNTKNRALTFNPNSSGAKPIYIDGEPSSESNYTLPSGLYHVYYDGTNWYFNPDGSISCSGVRVADNTGFLKADGSVDNSNYITANNLVTINNQSLIGTGNITIQGGGSGGTSDYTQLSNLPTINGTTLTGNVNLATPEQLASKQDTLVSGTNIKTINGESILGSGNINNKKKLKILSFGNSYSCDALAYTPFIFDDICGDVAEVEIGILVYSGCTLEQHYNFITNNSTSYTYYHITSGDTAWTSTANTKVSDVINLGWDCITLQQKSTDSPVFSTYEPYLTNIIDYIFSHTDNVKLGWILTQSSADDSTRYPDATLDPLSKYWGSTAMYNGIVECAEKIMKEYPFQFVLPSGTCIQYARNNTNLIEVANQLSASDGYHLQEGLPSLISAYSCVLLFCDLLNINAGIVGNNIRPTSSWLSGKSIPSPQGSSVGVTDENVYTAQKSSIMAVKDNFRKWFDDGFTFGFYATNVSSHLYDGRTTLNNPTGSGTGADPVFLRTYYSNVEMYHKDENVKITIPSGYKYRLVNSASSNYPIKSSPSSCTRDDEKTATNTVVLTSADFATDAHPYWGVNISKSVDGSNVSPFPYIQLYRDGFKVEKIQGGGSIPESIPESITIDDTTYTIDTLTGNKIYTFTNPLTSLTIVAFGDTSLETILYFTTGTGFMFGVPNGTRYIIESPIFNEGMSYVVSIKDGTIVMGEIE